MHGPRSWLKRHNGVVVVTSRFFALVLSVAIVACGNGEGGKTTIGDGLFPDVVDVMVQQEADGSYTFDVTISSSYDSPDRYADAWRVRSDDGTVYGVRELLHDHAGEQPFTRSLRAVEIPPDVEKVVVEGRDLINGWGGETMRVDLP